MTLRGFFSEYMTLLRQFLSDIGDFFLTFNLVFEGTVSILDIPFEKLLLMLAICVYVLVVCREGFIEAKKAYYAEYTEQIYALSIPFAFLVTFIKGYIFALKIFIGVILVYPLLMV